MNCTRLSYSNCQGVFQKRLELLNLVQKKTIDILLLNETHLFVRIYTTHKIQTNSRPSVGGMAILIRRKFCYQYIQINTTLVTNTAIQIRLGKHDIIFKLVAAYKSSNTILQTEDIKKLLDMQ